MSFKHPKCRAFDGRIELYVLMGLGLAVAAFAVFSFFIAVTS
jgi:hypothetical protein